MEFSAPTLHSPVVRPEDKAAVEMGLLAAKLARLSEPKALLAATPDSFNIHLSTVSKDNGFDSRIDIRFKGSDVDVNLLVDSGNSVLIVPYCEDIQALQNFAADYELLGAVTEPWGCPAVIMRGPIDIPRADGGLFHIPNCVFYACTANLPDGTRTANFGAGCLSPWRSSGWNRPLANVDVTLQAPLSYATDFPYAEFNYAPAASIMSGHDAAPKIATGSYLTMHKTMPPGYAMFEILKDKAWMSVIAKSLTIGGIKTKWPNPKGPPLAMVDTGGTCVYLSDPDGYLYDGTWPSPADNPDWALAPQICQSISGDIAVEIGDTNSSYSYKIDPSLMPPSVRGLTLVMCQLADSMRGQLGMNIGGISALSNSILIDYNAKVGFKPK